MNINYIYSSPPSAMGNKYVSNPPVDAWNSGWYQTIINFTLPEIGQQPLHQQAQSPQWFLHFSVQTYSWVCVTIPSLPQAAWCHAFQGTPCFKWSHGLSAFWHNTLCQLEHVFCPSSTHKYNAFSILIRHLPCTMAITFAVGGETAKLAWNFLFFSSWFHEWKIHSYYRS